MRPITAPSRAALVALAPALLPALLGAGLFALLAGGVLFAPQAPLFGTDIYDRLYLALVGEGRFDLPPRVLRLEGHYTPDGTGYLYHGLAPLLTRLAAGWAVDLSRVSLAGVSVWLWAGLGTALWHLTLDGVLGQGMATSRRRRGWARLGLAVLVWLAGPGLLVAANHALFHEPLAVAYAAVAGIAWLLVAVARGRLSLGAALPLLALGAGLVLHARPHLAPGLFAAVVALVGLDLWRRRRAGLAVAALTLLVLAGAGALLLWLNLARFGDPWLMHGSFAPSGLQYGTYFWGGEDPAGPRAQAFEAEGRFSPWRLPANLFIHLFDLRLGGPLAPVSEAIGAIFEGLKGGVGEIRLDGPWTGMAYLWPLWLLLAGVGLGAAMTRHPVILIGLGGLLAGTLLMLCYPTVTLRYKVDMVGPLGLLAACGLVRLGPWLAALPARRAARVGRLGGLLIALGALFSLATAHDYAQAFLTDWQVFRPWSLGECLDMARARGFDEARAAVLCRP
ncbi:hypothetical protein [Roseospirillum parvum]|uniref:4-amino-4-deoxy-L-arabinose transferase n=1 Tax=Roseospirillum parvum TaxID=83401 RepID=A0A1G8D0B3_9PROT|nr:hypothetical protein [Roseospirillum parvum]SDH50640.1 hypothetical protein SAMN05421742_107135 [Roseospirillum parvum]